MIGFRERLLRGIVIPAHPLALDSNRKLDARRQRALTRYYMASGAGGVAVGVHTTQFAIRDSKVGLLKPVLEIAAEEIGGSPTVKIAGVCGLTRQAVSEAELAASLGYDAALVSLAAMPKAETSSLLDHIRSVAAILPVFGFYMQTAVGGRFLSYEFWRTFVELDNVVAIKIAPFNRYQTLDVMRALADSGRGDEIALYTGNDDNILMDLLARYPRAESGLRIVGGLLGHWAVWTSRAREYFERATSCSTAGGPIDTELLMLNAEITDANAALFDAANGFRGCIAGIHEILRRQGLLSGRWCLDTDEDLSPGQMEEIDRVCRHYPHLQDDEFVREHLDSWMH